MAEQAAERRTSKSGDHRLRTGWTTGACATAATRAAYEALLTGRFPDPVTITLPKGSTPSFALTRTDLGKDFAVAAVVKDAGDDPDVTHGARVEVTVRPAPTGTGVAFRAGEGVGTVTRPGLPVSVGEPAINPGPRRMMRDVVRELAASHRASGDVEITVAIPGGEALAERTMNGRLGIAGGLSILGTTGIVTPYSCAAWIATIRQGIDVARAAGLSHVAGATGKTSEAAVARMYSLDETALLDMGDFVGALLKYLRRKPVPRLTIAGGLGKLAKLAAGHMDLHSSRSSVDTTRLAEHLAELGAPASLIEEVGVARSAGEVLVMARDYMRPLGDRVAAEARAVACDTLATTPQGVRIVVDVAIFDRAGGLIGHADA